MIIWLNGAFGAGKTQTAYALQRRLPGSYVCAPEKAGYFLRANLPSGLRPSDFQDLPLWRALTADMLRFLAERHPGHIIVPMTLVNRAYYDEITGACPGSTTSGTSSCEPAGKPSGSGWPPGWRGGAPGGPLPPGL